MFSKLIGNDEVKESLRRLLAGGFEMGALEVDWLPLMRQPDYDRLRRYPHWLASRNLGNEASDESVQALVAAVRGRADLPQRWYRVKARVLGLDRLADYDRLASVAEEEPVVPWREATDVVLDCYDSFSPELANVARRFLAEGWVDAPVRPGKRPGAFCAYTVPSVHPYVLLNYTSRRSDVLTLAHELGHGLHAYLAARQGVFHQSTCTLIGPVGRPEVRPAFTAFCPRGMPPWLRKPPVCKGIFGRCTIFFIESKRSGAKSTTSANCSSPTRE